MIIVMNAGAAQAAIDRVVKEISARVSFLAPVLLLPGENELEALAMGVREVLLGEAQAMTYRG